MQIGDAIIMLRFSKMMSTVCIK